MKFSLSLGLLSSTLTYTCLAAPTSTSTYTNPILPGWHSDPSCIFVKDLDNTFFCVTSTFLAFPGLPVYASKDLIHWKQISSVLNRPAQFSTFGQTSDNQGGIWAPTIRYHKGTIYVITANFRLEDAYTTGDPFTNLIFNTTNPYDNSAWSDALFYDTAAVGIVQTTISPGTGVLGGSAPYVWNGTGASNPEGPHMYQKDGYYYLSIAEGGTELGHRQAIARSLNPSGPFTSNPSNPILTNMDTEQYFQCVGHADLFQDANGNWWGVALSTRSGHEYTTWPMGRETVLFPVTWNKGEWPVVSQQVQGKMHGPLPTTNLNIAGSGAFLNAPDVVNFLPGSSIPSHFVYWRYPKSDSYKVSPAGHSGKLRLTPSASNLTGSADFNYTAGQTLLARRQVDSLFTYTIDFTFSPQNVEEETGVSVFLTQDRHFDLGIVLMNSTSSKNPTLNFRFRTETTGNASQLIVQSVPAAWKNQPIQLKIQAENITHYTFSVALASAPLLTQKVIGYAPASLVSSGYTGSLVGAYATNNGYGGQTPSYISNWRYTGQGQYIGDGVYV